MQCSQSNAKVVKTKAALDQPQRAHAGPSCGPDDHMVVHNHLHVPTGLHEIASQADVLLRGRRIAARVVVDDDQRGGSERDGAGDHLAIMDRGFVDATLPQSLIREQHVLGVEEQDPDLLRPSVGHGGG